MTTYLLNGNQEKQLNTIKMKSIYIKELFHIKMKSKRGL